MTLATGVRWQLRSLAIRAVVWRAVDQKARSATLQEPGVYRFALD